MKIFFERTGGFAGVHNKVEIDTEKISKKEQQEIMDRVDKSSFFTLPAKSKPTSIIDGFHYEIRIENGKKHTIKRSDGAIEEKLKPLFEFLTKYIHKK